MTSELQSASAIVLVRPAAFGFHAEAAESNAFASASADADLTQRVNAEFDGLARRLADSGIDVLVLDDQPDPAKPDAIFPNNWMSTHADGTIVLYPMATEARRHERDPERLKALLESAGYDIRRVVDLSFHERHGHFLEGTGSLILDRPARRAFASLGPRTDPVVIADFDDRLDYSTLLFEAHDRSGRPIYHTNVLMSLGTEFALLCTDVIGSEFREVLIDELEANGRTVIAVDFDQLRQFVCNLIELRGKNGPVIALSAAAKASLRPGQRSILESFGELVDAPIPTIEGVGGGSVRCMIAEIHLPRISPAT